MIIIAEKKGNLKSIGGLHLEPETCRDEKAGFDDFCNLFCAYLKDNLFPDVPDEVLNMGFSNEWSLSAEFIRKQQLYQREFYKSMEPVRETFYNIFLFGENQYVTFKTSKSKRTGILISDNSKNVEVELLEFSPGINRKRETRTGVIIKRHKKKHQVRVYPYGIRPIN